MKLIGSNKSCNTSEMQISFSVADNNQVVKIPYRASKGSGSPNIGFIDLKAQPERISEIHELKGYPEFEEFIRWLIRPEGIYATLRCDTAKDVVFTHLDYQKSFFCHSSICFAKPQPDDALFYRDFYRAFVQYAASFNLPDAVVMDFVLMPLEVTPVKLKGWCLDVWLYGYGHTEEEARHNWSDGLRVLKNYLSVVEQDNR